MANQIATKAISELRNIVRNELPMKEYLGEVEDFNGALAFSCRYFGGTWGWMNPPEARDEEDYDWKVPTVNTTLKMDQMLVALGKKFPSVELSWHEEGEKCWVVFVAKSSK